MKNVYFIAIAAACCFFCASCRQPASKAAAENIILTDVRLSALDGSPVDLPQFKGKTVFINFWATWCKPCLREMPSIQRLMEQMPDDEVVFLFASDESPDKIEEFKNSNNFPFEYVVAQNPEELNISALPTTFIFNPHGKLVYQEVGYRKWDKPDYIRLLHNIAKEK